MAYRRGYKPAPPHIRELLHEHARKRHNSRIGGLPKATQPAFDCAGTPGYVVLPVNDQGQCGDCFMVSSFDCASMALAKVGVLPATEDGRLSSQFGLDCHEEWGGCNGGDEAQVIDWLKNNTAPLQKDYGPYTASASTCKSITGMATYKIADWGYCTPAQQQGVADTQDMKNCILQYGPISVAFDASECDSYSGGTMTGNGNNVDHAVICRGWDDNHDNGDGSKGAFIGQNQWGASWGITINGIQGSFWIKYGADSWGTEAIWILGGAIPPPGPVPPPVPPGPVPPPVPPGPIPPPPVPPTPIVLNGNVTIPPLTVTVAGVHTPLTTLPITIPISVSNQQMHAVSTEAIPWSLLLMILQQGISFVCNNITIFPAAWQPIIKQICGFIPHQKQPCGGCK